MTGGSCCPWHVPVAEKGHDKAHALRLCGGHLEWVSVDFTLGPSRGGLTQTLLCLCLADFQNSASSFSSPHFPEPTRRLFTLINDCLPSSVATQKLQYIILWYPLSTYTFRRHYLKRNLLQCFRELLSAQSSAFIHCPGLARDVRRNSFSSHMSLDHIILPVSSLPRVVCAPTR